jgi:hypothetical protein
MPHLFKQFIILCIIILQVFAQEQYEQKGTLRWAFEIFRHGARTPYDGFNENFEDCFGHKWIGKKELTGVGLRQHFLVGYRNRLKYIEEKKLLSEQYNPKEVYLASTDSNRTIMSANAQVQGLYPPGNAPPLFENQTNNAVPPVKEEDYKTEKEQLDNDGYATLPNHITIMPVHILFNSDHYIQLQDKKVCPHTKELYKINQEREEVKQFLSRMKEKYGNKIIEVAPREDASSFDDYAKTYYILDTVISEYTEGVDRYKDVCQKLGVSEDELLNDAYEFFRLDLVGNGTNNDKEICLNSMSPIFDRLLQYMNDKIEKDKVDESYVGYDLPKFVMYSAHDSTCGAFMGFMKAVFNTDIEYPYFATNINLELYKDGDGNSKENYRVDYIINDKLMANIRFTEFESKINQNKKSAEAINNFCQFEKSESSTEPTTDGQQKQDNKESNDDNDGLYIGLNIGLAVVAVILIILIIITIRKRKSGQQEINNEEIMGGDNDKKEILGGGDD